MAFDLWTKWHWFGNEASLIPHIISITSHKNEGLLFNIPSPWWLSGGITALFLLGLCYIAYTRTNKHSLQTYVSLWMIIGGGLGNLWDRLTLHFVRDWMLFFERSALNAADVCIFTGMFLIGLEHLRHPQLDTQEK